MATIARITDQDLEPLGEFSQASWDRAVKKYGRKGLHGRLTKVYQRASARETGGDGKKYRKARQKIGLARNRAAAYKK